MYGIIRIIERSDAYGAKIELLYQSDDIEEFKTRLRGLLISPNSNKLLILRVEDPIDIKLLGYKQLFLFPYYQIIMDQTKLSRIIYDGQHLQSKSLLQQTLLSIEGVVQYLQMTEKLWKERWSKKQFKHGLVHLGYLKRCRCQSKAKLQRLYLNEYYLQMLSQRVYSQLRDQLKNETSHWSRKRFKRAFSKLGYRKSVWYRSKAGLFESYVRKYYLSSPT